jgi:hypothetical protein
MSDPKPEDESQREGIIRAFVEEPMLWPVGIVVVLIVITFGAAILVFAIRLRSLFAGIALLLLIFMTVWGLEQDFRERRLRPLSRLLLGLWGGSALAAVGLEWLGALQ